MKSVSVCKETEPKRNDIKCTNSFTDSDQNKQTVGLKTPLNSMLLEWIEGHTVFTGYKGLGGEREKKKGRPNIYQRNCEMEPSLRPLTVVNFSLILIGVYFERLAVFYVRLPSTTASAARTLCFLALAQEIIA